MTLRPLKLALLGILAIGAALVLVNGIGAAQTLPSRVPFLIATGPTGGTYFPVGQAIAGIISSPPGLYRCRIADLCGPAGLMASVRTSDGSVANVLAVNAGAADSGMAQADVVANARAGRGPFRKTGAQQHVTVLTALFPEQVHLVVGARTHIASVNALRGKRVSLGELGSGTYATARDVLAAYGLSERNLKLAAHDTVDEETQDMEDGKLDAFFFVGAAPVPLISDLVAWHAAKLVPIDGPGRQRLLKTVRTLNTDRIAAGTYRGTPATDTVSVRALWIVRDSIEPALAYGILKALFNPANRDALASAPAARAIRLDAAARDLPAPLHPGAARFFRDAGKI